MAKENSQPVRVPQLLFGLVLLGAGVTLLLSRLDVVEVSFWAVLGTWWPLLIIAAGLAALATVPRAWPGPVAIIAVGVFFQLARLDLFDLDLSTLIWPVILIALGLALIVRVGRAPSESADTIRQTVFWWGAARRSRSQQFRSAVLTAVMGGIEVDLREADIQGRADISIFTFWGGVEIKVPPTWRVTVRGLPLLGGWDDKTVEPQGDAPELVIHVTTIMAGAEIKN